MTDHQVGDRVRIKGGLFRGCIGTITKVEHLASTACYETFLPDQGSGRTVPFFRDELEPANGLDTMLGFVP